ncbi:MAG: hypothetical protein KC620_26030 [Myxococcales bacterium]|nr:hypothetical protein [Myxococcales bacterium]
MSDALRDQIVRYLDGAASASERAALERSLLDDAVARLFAEELLLRDLLRHAPPEVPPAEVMARWEAAVLGELGAEDQPEARWFSQVMETIGWSLRGPALSINTAGTGQARRGLATLLYGVPVRREPPPKPWWRRALAWRR